MADLEELTLAELNLISRALRTHIEYGKENDLYHTMGLMNKLRQIRFRRAINTPSAEKEG